jgi:2'-hydroxyisoflavone reductase
MTILVLGGTVFLGRHFVEAALTRGHELTLFHRGRHGADLFPDVRHVLGDRDGGLDALDGRSFDAVVDCCGYVPRVVRQSAQALAGRVGSYLFVSTISVYPESAEGPNERSAVIELEDPTTEDIPAFYGGLKALCEREVQEAFGERGLIVRPGLIVGPFDPSNRFTYWVDRLARGGEVLVPNRPDQPMQLIDARDLGLFMVLGLEHWLGGVYNTVGEDTTIGAMLEACLRLNLGTQLIWADYEFLAQNEVKPWQDLPLMLGPDPESDGAMRTDGSKARAAGLVGRPLEQTARETWEWRRALPDDSTWAMGMSRERELQILSVLAGSSAVGQ